MLYRDIDIKPDPTFGNSGPDPNILDYMSMAGLNEVDLAATQKEFTSQEVRVGGKWLRCVLKVAVRALAGEHGPNLASRWLEASRVDRFLHHSVYFNLLHDYASVGVKSLVYAKAPVCY